MGRPRSISYVIYSSFFISCFIFQLGTASDTLTLGQSIKDSKTLVSSRKIFQLGFFSNPTELSNPYVGIWYYNLLIRRIIWVANREKSVMDSSGVLTLNGDGNLVILDGRQNTVWSTDTSSALNRSVEAVLLDTGNFVLRERDSGSSLGRILWQSFNYPTDTLLPGMMIGINQRTGKAQKLTSWKDFKDPSPGAFSFGIDLQGLRQFFIFNGLNPYYKSMFWNGTSFEVLPPSSQRLVNFTVISNTDETYFTYSSSLSNYPSMVMDPSGKLNYIWYNGTGDAISEESIVWSGPEHTCGEYGTCGVYSSCNDNNTPICKCLPGFEPTSRSDWLSGEWSEGCKRKTPLHCGNGKEDKFLEMQGMQLGTLESVQGPANATAEACRAECLRDCLCVAYANVTNDVCTYWKEDLHDVKEAEEVNMVDLYLRLAPSEIETPGRSCPNCGANIIPYPLSTGPDCGDPDYSNFHCNTTSGQLRFGALNGVSYAITSINPIRRTFEIQLEETRVCWPSGAKSKDVNLNRSLPFSFTNGNTVLLLNCATPLLMSRANCTSSSLCQRYVGEGPASCLDSATCCSYVAGGFSPSSSHSIGVMNTPCSAYTSILNENLTKPASNWQVGMEIGWDLPPEPICNSTNDCRSWPHTMCLPDGKKIGRRRCICSANFKWNSLSLNCTPDDVRNTGMRRSSGKKRPLALIVTITVIAGIFFMGTLIFCLWRMAFKIKGIKVKNSKKHSTHSGTSVRRNKDSLHTNGFGEDGKEELNVPYFDFETLASATENFADYNKLGQGGFGPVYKGKLPDGQEIAVKRLSQSSGQGQEEFKNEVVLIAKLQHRNLVRLLGYCIEGDEKMLLYEFLPNKSLDFFIFDPNQCKLLDWERRFNIIIGIARGLLYLHQDSRLRIIHRDLKTSNVLLDDEMNPKISDFGMARMFGGNQIEANTIRVVGTYGYMAPEYASHGLFSIKSDVFSFGVILLEIVCGKKNTVFYQSQDSLTLLGHAWQLWNEGKGLDLIDPSISLKCNTSLALKCIHVGLLCVQEDPKARPTMASIITMLGSEAVVSVTPKKPAFFMSLGHAHLSLEEQSNSSRNEETMSTMDGR